MEMFLAVVFATLTGAVAGIFLGSSAGRHDERKRWEQLLILRSAGLTRDASAATRVESDAAPSELRQQRLEQAVDAIALEVERIAEGQRYVSKLLSDSRPRAPGSTTPRSPVPGSVRASA